ncbi:MAG: hypothetical protein SVN78_09880 [Deferribacterota bacterium]|nr:hypothetical protein [Deferribacterota bacterium]
MISIDITLFFQVINFIIVIVISKYMIADPLIGAIEKRNNKILSLEQQVNEKKKKIEELQKLYEQKKLDAKRELNELKKDTIEDTKKEVSNSIQRERQKLDKYYKEQLKDLNKLYEKLIVELEKDMPGIKKLIIQKVL